MLESELLPMIMLASEEFAPTGFMPLLETFASNQDHEVILTQEAYVANQDLVDVWPRLLQGAMSGSVILCWPSSELTSMNPVA